MYTLLSPPTPRPFQHSDQGKVSEQRCSRISPCGSSHRINLCLTARSAVQLVEKEEEKDC